MHLNTSGEVVHVVAGQIRGGVLSGAGKCNNNLTPCPLLTWSLLLEEEMAEKVEEEDEVEEEEEDGL